jgi:TorA maturation chaperone TorD
MPDDDQMQGAARADLCRFLAACYYQPGPEFAEEKVFDSMAAAAALINPELAAGARRLGEAFAAENPDDLLVDYTRLFLGPIDTRAKPYGSVWLGGDTTLMQDSTMAVLAMYAEGGFDLAEDFRELPDHIAAELEFLYLLIWRENAARRSRDAEALAATTALRRRFLTEHLRAWVGPFAAAVREGAETAYYRELAEVTDRFVALEASRSGAA